MCRYVFIIFNHKIYDQAAFINILLKTAFIRIMIIKKRNILSGCKAEDSKAVSECKTN